MKKLIIFIIFLYSCSFPRDLEGREQLATVTKIRIYTNYFGDFKRVTWYLEGDRTTTTVDYLCPYPILIGEHRTYLTRR